MAVRFRNEMSGYKLGGWLLDHQYFEVFDIWQVKKSYGY